MLSGEDQRTGFAETLPNVEISALINLGFDDAAAGQYDQALSSLEQTLARVEEEAIGSHRWRWRMKLLIGVAELRLHTGAYQQALQEVDNGLQDALATSSRRYMARGWAVRGKIMAKLGNHGTALAELQRACELAEQIHSPTLLYPIATELGQCYETVGNEQEAMVYYKKAKEMVEQIGNALEDQTLQSTFLQSEPVLTALTRLVS